MQTAHIIRREMNEAEQAVFDAVFDALLGVSDTCHNIELRGVTTAFEPHPYCITDKHVTVASDHFSGQLGIEAIEYAEAMGAHCGERGCKLSYSQHETLRILLIAIGDDLTKDEWKVFVNAIKAHDASASEKTKLAGIGFANKNDDIAILRKIGVAK